MTNATVLWEACAAAIQDQVSDVVWQMTFNSAEPVAADAETLTVSVPSTILRDRIEGRYRTMVDEAVAQISDDQLSLQIVIREEVDEEPPLRIVPSAPAREPLVPPPMMVVPDPPSTTSTIPMTSTSSDVPFAGRLTFEDFVIGSSNRFAHAAAQAVAETPGRSYNPLFIYGDAGLGKTHLLQAVGNYVITHYPTYRVQYVSSETFMNRFVEAIRNKQLPEFKDRFRKNDVLLVDDIQFMEGKEGLQEEFFHTFNSIQQEGGQIVLTSDRSPDSISTLEDRLRSRFKMGLVTHIQPPDVETRLAILRKKAETTPSGIQVPDDVLLFIAESINDNIRELEGALTRVTAYSSLNHEPCTKALAVSILSDLISSNSPLMITPELILSKTTDFYGFSREELIGPNRRRPLVTARQISMYVFRELTDLSYPSIARVFGGRDHTTVMHAKEKIDRLMPERRDIYDQVSALIASIRSGT